MESNCSWLNPVCLLVVLMAAGWWEKSHRFLVKMPYLRVGKNTKRLYELLMVRVLLADRVRQMLRVVESLERRDVDWLPTQLGDESSSCRIIKRL